MCTLTDKYEFIKNIVKSNNSVVIYDVTIAGESMNGLSFSIPTILTFLHKHFENDTYHPYLFRYMVGVSSGTVTIDLLLKARYLYEKIGKKTALNFLDCIYTFLNYNNFHNIFTDTGGNDPFYLDKNLNKVIRNIFRYGSFFQRDALGLLLRIEYPDFEFKNNAYFTSKDYYDWLKDQLDNIFYITYSVESSIIYIYTGNVHRYKDGSSFQKYIHLTVDNYIHAIECSSSIQYIYPAGIVENSVYCTDGASVSLNLMNILMTVVKNLTYYEQSQVYRGVIDFFEITVANNQNFLIFDTVLNLQQQYEDVQRYRISGYPFFETLLSGFYIINRIIYNSSFNTNLLNMFLTQPFFKDYSISDMNLVNGEALTTKKNILYKQDNVHLILTGIKSMYENIPFIEVDETKFNGTLLSRVYNCSYGEYVYQYRTFKEISTNQPLAYYIYDYKTNTVLDTNDKNIIVNIATLNAFARTYYDFSLLTQANVILNIQTKEAVDTITVNRNAGVIQGNSLYNSYILQQASNVGGTIGCINFNLVRQQAYLDFVGTFEG